MTATAARRAEKPAAVLLYHYPQLFGHIVHKRKIINIPVQRYRISQKPRPNSLSPFELGASQATILVAGFYFPMQAPAPNDLFFFASVARVWGCF